MQICPGDGGRNYIAFSPTWLKKVYDETQNKWALYGIIAHEIGHYVKGHQNTAVGSNHTVELEADEYAGVILAKMGASLLNAQTAYRSKIMASLESHTHPPIAQRLAKVKEGWERGKRMPPISPVSLTSSDKLRHSNSQKITIGSTGYIDGLNGRLNPILDSYKRTYIYGDNIAIEGGKNQPVGFSPNQPFVVEDSLGNQFELKILPISDDSFTIDYKQLSSAEDKQRADLNVEVTDHRSRPVRGAEVIAIFSDGTYLKGTTDVRGNAHIEKLKQRVVTVYCAHQNYRAFYKEEHNADSELVISFKAERGKGSVVIFSAGYIPGLDGRVNPILDSINRTYLYANDISIENGREQPATFTLNKPFQVEDKDRRKFELTVVAIKSRTSLIEFTRLN